MAYEIINETLRIKSCYVRDLTLKQTQQFLEMWEDGAKIGDLTLFYEYETDYLVLNREYMNYDSLQQIAQKYLLLDDDSAKTLREQAPKTMQETMQLLEEVRKRRFLLRELKINGYQQVYGFADTYLGSFFKELMKKDSNSISFLMSQAYSYGLICGKRMERARRKKGTAA